MSAAASASLALPPGAEPVPVGFRIGAPNEEAPWVLIPGIRGDPCEFAALAPLLPGERILVATSLLQLRSRPTPQTLSEFSARLLEHLPPGRWRVIGASFGGLIARGLPAERVEVLVTVGTLPAPSPASRRAGWMGRIVPLLPSPLYHRLYSRHDGKTREVEGSAAVELRAPPGPELGARLRAIGRWGVPTLGGPGRLALWGSSDPWLTWNEADVRAEGWTPGVVPGGHFPHISHPDEVWGAIRSLLHR